MPYIEVSEYLKITNSKKSTIYAKIKKGEIDSFVVRNRTFIEISKEKYAVHACIDLGYDVSTKTEAPQPNYNQVDNNINTQLLNVLSEQLGETRNEKKEMHSMNRELLDDVRNANAELRRMAGAITNKLIEQTEPNTSSKHLNLSNSKTS